MFHNCCPEERVFRNTAEKLCSLRQISCNLAQPSFAKQKSCQLCSDLHLVLECPFVVEMSRELCRCEGCFKLADYSGRCGMCSTNCPSLRCLMKETDLSTIEPEYLCYFEDDREEILQILQSKTCRNSEHHCTKFIVGKDKLFCTGCEKQIQDQKQDQDDLFDHLEGLDLEYEELNQEEEDIFIASLECEEQNQDDLFDLLEGIEYEEQ